jgi:hypothetical protein
MPMWDKRGWWPHGLTKMQWARRPVGYLAKCAQYAAKAPQESSPEFHTKSARWWGIGGIVAATRSALRLALAPGWVQRLAAALDVDDRVKRIQYGWWRIGPWEFRSPWELLSFDPAGALIRWRGWGQFDYALA